MGGRSAKGNEVMLVVPLTCIALLSGSGDAANSRISTIKRKATSFDTSRRVHNLTQIL